MKYNTRNRKGDVFNTDTLYLVKKDTGIKKVYIWKIFERDRNNKRKEKADVEKRKLLF